MPKATLNVRAHRRGKRARLITQRLSKAAAYAEVIHVVAQRSNMHQAHAVRLVKGSSRITRLGGARRSEKGKCLSQMVTESCVLM